MTFHVNPKGRNWGSLVNWDDLGKLYAGIAIAWTIILYTGATWLFINRNISFLRIRNIPLAIAAVSFLHVYLVKILLAYTTNGHFLCSAEFWIMSIYLPLGIALFQANVAQLQSVSEQQQKLLEADGLSNRRSLERHPSGYRGLVSRWHALTALHKTYLLIGLGMTAQVRRTQVPIQHFELTRSFSLLRLLQYMELLESCKDTGRPSSRMQRVKPCVGRDSNGKISSMVSFIAMLIHAL